MFKVVGAAEAVAGSEDLKREILVRLPAKSVTRFKLVSKQWCSLISGPQFVQSLVLRRNPNKLPTGIFFCRRSVSSSKDINFISFGDDGVPSSSCEVVVGSLSFLDDAFEPTKILILQSCNGLFLCRIYRCDLSGNNYCVFNPTTRQYRLLPQPTKHVSSFTATLAFDPCVSLHYKVVFLTLAFQGHGGTFEFDIYSSESQSWRSKSYGFQQPLPIDLGPGKFFNGAIHWLRRENSLCFDVYSEEILQTEPRPQRDFSYLKNCGTHFHLVTSHSPQGEDFFILELSRDFSNWVNKYKVSASAIPDTAVRQVRHGRKIPLYMELCVVKGVREEDSVLVLKMPGKLVSYNFMTEEVKTICGYPVEHEIFGAFPVMETLCSV